MPLINVGDRIPHYCLTGVKPGVDSSADDSEKFLDIDNNTFEGKWKLFVFYPKDFTTICPTEIKAFDSLHEDWEKRDTVVLFGNTDNEYCKVAFKQSNPDLQNLKSWMFADLPRMGMSPLCYGVGAYDGSWGHCTRTTILVDPNGIVQYVQAVPSQIGRGTEEVLRVLDAIQTGEMCACDRPIGGETMKV
jgi:alkyl hydroperoxide reductase subunit AhpC